MKKQLINFKYTKKDYEFNEQEKDHLKHFLGKLVKLLFLLKNFGIGIYSHIKEKVLVNEKLYHLGRTFVLEKQAQTDKTKKDIVYTFKEAKNDAYMQDLIMCMDMVNFHFPNLYQEGLANLVKFG